MLCAVTWVHKGREPAAAAGQKTVTLQKLARPILKDVNSKQLNFVTIHYDTPKANQTETQVFLGFRNFPLGCPPHARVICCSR